MITQHIFKRPNVISKLATRKMHIQSIPMRWGRGDNYSYLITDEPSGKSVIVDPAEPDEVLPTLRKMRDLKLTAVINTHHHYDHAGGNKQVVAAFDGIPIWAGEDSPGVNYIPKDNDSWEFGENVSIRTLKTPCHTRDSTCFLFTDKKTNDKAVFTGDTLFIAGCGRFFEGDAKDMIGAMRKLGSLPDDTHVYPGHEYTRANIKFAKTVMNNDALAKLDTFANGNTHTTGAFTIGDEKEFNPFMRSAQKDMQSATGETDEVKVMAKLREMKNSM